MLAVFFILAITLSCYVATACGCIGMDKQTTQTALDFADLTVKGKIISVEDYEYYDSASYWLAAQNKPAIELYVRREKYKLYKVVVQTKFKSSTTPSDTIQIVTGYGAGDCGYVFEIGKEYIIYAETWKENVISKKNRNGKLKGKLVSTPVAGWFYTDICTRTQLSNNKELENLKRLAE